MCLTHKMEPTVSGMLDNWAAPAFSAVVLPFLLRQAFTELPRLASNSHLFIFPRSWNYRCEPPCLGFLGSFN